MARKKPTVSFIGAGNVAHHLSHHLDKKKFSIQFIYTRSIASGRKLALQVGGVATSSLKKLKQSDYIIIAVSDDAISSVVGAIVAAFKESYKGVIAHTAGSVSTDELGRVGSNYGSFYPLQTFSKSRKIEFSKVPFFITGNHEQSTAMLEKLASNYSDEVEVISDEDRGRLHLAAVILNNFINHLIYVSDNYLDQHGLKVEHLYPLIEETILKSKSMKPRDAQTGPARRGDMNVIHGHIKTLSKSPQLKKIYKTLSQSILKEYDENNS